eukprot:scaffold34741_cov33-Cyclotella_meneghiniana.AAC.1
MDSNLDLQQQPILIAVVTRMHQGSDDDDPPRAAMSVLCLLSVVHSLDIQSQKQKIATVNCFSHQPLGGGAITASTQHLNNIGIVRHATVASCADADSDSGFSSK